MCKNLENLCKNAAQLLRLALDLCLSFVAKWRPRALNAQVPDNLAGLIGRTHIHVETNVPTRTRPSTPPRSIPSRRPRDLAVWCERLCLCMFCIDSDARHMRELHIKHRRRAPRFASARPGLRVLNAFGRFGGGLAAVKLRTFRTFRTF